MAKLFILLIGLTLTSCGAANYYQGLLDSHRQVNAGVYIQYVSSMIPFYEEDDPYLTVKVVNDTAFQRRISVSCNLDYLVGSDETQEVISTLAPRQWKRLRFSGRPTDFRMTATCNLDRFPE